MKCPVCQTKIKNNETICPNCGFILKKETNNNTFEPIADRLEPANKESKLKLMKEYYDSLSYSEKSRFTRLSIRSIICAFGAFCVFMSFFNNTIDKIFNNDNYGIYSSEEAKTFLDDHTIINMADEHKDDLKKLYNDLSIIDAYTQEKFEYGNNMHEIYNLKDALYSQTSLTGIKIISDTQQYEYITFIQGSLNGIDNVSITVKGQYIGGYNESFEHLDKDDLETIFTHYNMNEAYNNLKTASKMLSIYTSAYRDEYNSIIHEEKNMYSGILNGYEITIIETHIAQYNTTNFEYTIKK